MEMEMETTVSEAGEEGRAEKLQRVLEQWQVTEPLWQLDDEEQRRRKLEDEEDREEYDRQFNEHRERYKTLSLEANQYMETIGSLVGQERINALREWSERIEERKTITVLTRDLLKKWTEKLTMARLMKKGGAEEEDPEAKRKKLVQARNQKQKIRRSEETAVETDHRQTADRERAAERSANETEDHREQRQKAEREGMAVQRQNELANRQAQQMEEGQTEEGQQMEQEQQGQPAIVEGQPEISERLLRRRKVDKGTYDRKKVIKLTKEQETKKAQTYLSNMELPVKDRNPYYHSQHFQASRNDYDWFKAMVSNELYLYIFSC
jgi:hypothetical protein